MVVQKDLQQDLVVVVQMDLQPSVRSGGTWPPAGSLWTWCCRLAVRHSPVLLLVLEDAESKGFTENKSSTQNEKD